jgi:hypothetical protein
VPAGDSTLADGGNMTVYTRTWAVPGNERGVPFWYRVAYSEDGARWNGPARRFASPVGPPVATVEVTIAHNAYDNDVDATVDIGGGSSSSLDGSPDTPPALSYPLPGSAAAIATDWVTGLSTNGNIAWTFAIEIPPGPAELYLPRTGTTTGRFGSPRAAT